MAGGMTSGQGRETLAERVANTRGRTTGHSTADMHGKPPVAWADALRDAPTEPVPPTVRHCWYDGPYGRQAALLLEWRNVGGAYDGRTAVAAPDVDGWAIVEMWVGSGLLSPS